MHTRLHGVSALCPALRTIWVRAVAGEKRPEPVTGWSTNTSALLESCMGSMCDCVCPSVCVFVSACVVCVCQRLGL